MRFLERKETKMITKGLKKGEKFEDGGRYFIIEEVLATGDYISHQISEKEYASEDEKPKKAKKTETKAEETAPSKEK